MTNNEDDMLNEDTSNLKSHLKSLHANLAQTGDVDEELKDLLRQLDGDIRQLLDRRAEEPALLVDQQGQIQPVEASATFGLAERSQELTARFAAEHPRLEPALRELGRMLSNMGI
jgi:septal ring factor EnvC (AmiA/AmiB activator)